MKGKPLKADSSNDRTPCAVREAQMSQINLSQLVFSLIILFGLLWYIKADLYKPLELAETMLVRLARYGTTIPQGYVELHLKRAGRILGPADQTAEIEQVVKYIQENTAPSEPIFDFSNQGGYYFLANRPNPTRFPQIIYASPEPLQKEAVADLEKAKPKYVIFKTGYWTYIYDGVSNLDRLPIVVAYLQSHYTEDVQIGSAVIWKRRACLRRGRDRQGDI